MEDLEIQNPDCFGTTKASSAEIIAGTEDNKYTSPKGLADAGIVPGGGVVPTVATGAEVTTGTDNAKFASPKAIKDAGIVAVTLPVKASGAEVTTGTDDAKFATAKALADAGINKARLIAETTVAGSDVTDVTISSLDLNACKGLIIEILAKSANGADKNLAIYVNADTTDAEYYRSLVFYNYAALGGETVNNSYVMPLWANSFSHGIINMSIGSDSKVTMLFLVQYHNSNSPGYQSGSCWKHTTDANVTSITIHADAASVIAVGTIIRVYRRN